MTKRIVIIASFALLLGWSVTAQGDGVVAVEIGRHNTDLLPQGKEADGIIGDFVLRNDKIEALVSGSQPLRRANWRTESSDVLQGCLFDLDLRGEANDQITAFRPGGERGEISYVRIAEEGSQGAAAVEAVRTSEKGDGLYTRHEYRLEEDWQYVLVTSTYRNESREPKKISHQPIWKEFRDSQHWNVGGIHVGDSADPFDKRAYAWMVKAAGAPVSDYFELQPGQEKIYQVFLAVADSPVAAYGVLAGLSTTTGEVSGRLIDSENNTTFSASLVVPFGGQELPAYPDMEGRVFFRLPTGEYRAQVRDLGRETIEQMFSVQRDERTNISLQLPRASAVHGEIRDESGNYLPAKVRFIGVEGTPDPSLGPMIRARGGANGYQTHDGRFIQQIPPGKYLLRITRGPEYDSFERKIEVGKGHAVDVEATLRRTVDTTGWISADFHAHSTPSGDNQCNTDDRIINHVAEHIEFAPSTEHNRIYDWEPHIKRLGLTNQIKTVVGLEHSGNGTHLNSFPLKWDPFAQNGGSPLWGYDPRINAMVLRNWGTPSLDSRGSRYDTEANASSRLPWFNGGPDRWVQINHPKFGEVFFDRNQDQVPDGGFAGLEHLVDAAETSISEDLLEGDATKQAFWGGRMHTMENPAFGWLQLLNQGRGVWCVGVSDAHSVWAYNSSGGSRTYVPSSTDDPSEIDPTEIIRNAKAGRMMLTNGPFLEVTTADGLPIGSTVVSKSYIDLKVKVQAANWLDLDRVQVLVNGRQPEDYNYTSEKYPHMFRTGTVRFHETLRIQLQRDAHLIVAATAQKSDLSKMWDGQRAEMKPLAYTNPIYVDVDGNGFQANGDTLDRSLLTAVPDPEPPRTAPP